MNKQTIEEWTKSVEKISTGFEQINTELKRKYIIWNIEVFNTLASHIKESIATFGTGYPFYVLDENLEGEIPIIQEQVRYNRQLVRDGEPFQKSIWECKKCLDERYEQMPDLKTICKPCPRISNKLKPRKLINRLPDIDMWIICKNGSVETTQEKLSKLLEKNNMSTSDKNPINTIEELEEVTEQLKQGIMPTSYLPIDCHIVEEKDILKLLQMVPEELEKADKQKQIPYLPILPKSYRKDWKYDDEEYNFIYDYLSAFTAFGFNGELKESLEEGRKIVASRYSPQKLLEFLKQSATDSNFRRFQTKELEEIFLRKVENWGEKTKMKEIQEELVEEL